MYNSRKLSLSTYVRSTGCFGHGDCTNFIRMYVYHGLQMVITKPPAVSHSVLLIGLVLHTPPLKRHTNTERMHRWIQGSRYVLLCRHTYAYTQTRYRTRIITLCTCSKNGSTKERSESTMSAVNIVSCCLLHSEVAYNVKICYFHTLHVADSLNSHKDMVIDIVVTAAVHPSQGKCLSNCDTTTDHYISINQSIHN